MIRGSPLPLPFPFCRSHEIMMIFFSLVVLAVGAVRPKLVCLVICQIFNSNTQLCLSVGGGEESSEIRTVRAKAATAVCVQI